MRSMLFGASLIVLATFTASTAAAAPAKHSVRHVEPHPVTVRQVPSPADMAAVFKMFDKIFPPQPDPDPARLALSRSTAAAIWPNGAYANMMIGMMGHAFDGAMQLKASDLAGGGVDGSAAASNLSLHDMAAAKDPYFDQRVAAVRQVVDEGASQVSAILDPRVREGLARAMARRFDQRQLADINAFFATPSGQALAGQYMQLWVDPDTMRAIFASMPEMMKLMPDMMQKVKAASDRFPAPKAAAAAHAKS